MKLNVTVFNDSGSAIDVNDMIDRIKAQRKMNVIEKENKRAIFLKHMTDNVERINGWRKDAEELVKVYETLKENGMKYLGEQMGCSGFFWQYRADGWYHNIGFVERKDGSVCLGAYGGGAYGDVRLYFLRNGRDVEFSFDSDKDNSIIGDALEVLGNPEKYGLDDELLHYFERRVTKMENEFWTFRADYIAFVERQLKR